MAVDTLEKDSLAQNVEDQLDQIFSALADRTRRAIYARLSAGPSIVRELAEPFSISMPAISKHLKVLEKAGLVSRTIEGRVHHCSLNLTPLSKVQSWLDSYRVFWEDNLDALVEYVEND